MGELVFIGLGLMDERSITLLGLDEARRCEVVLAEFYTNKMPTMSLVRLESLLGRPVKVLSRKQVEEDPMGEVLKHARDGRVAFLVSGDPMIATTHVELRILAERNRIRTRTVHSASIYSVAPGTVGLQMQKFGRTVSLPILEGVAFPDSAYDFIAQNKSLGLHTLVLLENRPNGKFISIPQAIEALMHANRRRETRTLDEDTLVIGLARLESQNPIVRGDRMKELGELDFGLPPHAMIIPGRLHFKEAEALEVFAHVPRALLEPFL